MGLGKQIEFALKSATSTLLRLWLAQPEKNLEPPYKRILFIRYGGIGDMILSLPVFRAAKEKSQAEKIDVICDRSNAAPILNTDWVDKISYYDKKPHKIIKLIYTLRKRDYDYVVNLIPYASFTFGLLARLIAPHAVRVAADQEEYSYLYNRNIELPPKRDIHMLKRLFLLSADITGNQRDILETPWIEYNNKIKKQALKIFSSLVDVLGTSANNPHIVAINVTAKLRRREWPLNKYAEFLKIVAERYKNHVDGWAIFSDPNKRETAHQLSQLVNLPSVITLPPIEDYRVIMEFLRYIFLLITPDTSFVHAASAMGTPVLDLMIGENIVTWDPIGVPHRIITSMDPVSLEDLPLKPVLDGFTNLIDEIT